MNCLYLRFYRNGQCICVNSLGNVSQVARWFQRERKGIPIGTYKVQGSGLTAVIEHGEMRLELKGRLTKQGLKVRRWSSLSNKEYDDLYAFHNVNLP